MPVYDFSVAADRLACIRDQPTRGRMQTIAEIVRRHYGDAAVEALREDYKKSAIMHFTTPSEKISYSTNRKTARHIDGRTPHGSGEKNSSARGGDKCPR